MICGIRNDVKMKDVIQGVFPFIVIIILYGRARLIEFILYNIQ